MKFKVQKIPETNYVMSVTKFASYDKFGRDWDSLVFKNIKKKHHKYWLDATLKKAGKFASSTLNPYFNNGQEQMMIVNYWDSSDAQRAR